MNMPYGIGEDEAGQWSSLGRENLRDMFLSAGSVFKNSHFCPVIYAMIKEIEDMVDVMETVIEDEGVDDWEPLKHFVNKYKGKRVSLVSREDTWWFRRSMNPGTLMDTVLIQKDKGSWTHSSFLDKQFPSLTQSGQSVWFPPSTSGVRIPHEGPRWRTYCSPQVQLCGQ